MNMIHITSQKYFGIWEDNSSDENRSIFDQGNKWQNLQQQKLFQ